MNEDVASQVSVKPNPILSKIAKEEAKDRQTFRVAKTLVDDRAEDPIRQVPPVSLVHPLSPKEEAAFVGDAFILPTQQDREPDPKGFKWVDAETGKPVEK